MRSVPTSSAAGVEASFDEFFAREARTQVQRAGLILGSAEEANDVVQEAFVRIYERWHELDHPGSYLNRTVLNLARDRMRRQSTYHRILPRLQTPPQATANEDEILGDILAELPFNQRAAIVLRYWGGLSNVEIAEQLECPTGSVGPWIDRGLKKLRKALQ